MSNHLDIDRRSLCLHQAIVQKIDETPSLLQSARSWAGRHEHQAIREWRELLQQDWLVIRQLMLDPGPEGQRLRQSSPFAGILTPQERWKIYRESFPT